MNRSQRVTENDNHTQLKGKQNTGSCSPVQQGEEWTGKGYHQLTPAMEASDSLFPV